ncbi:TPA: restriction endonuclease subunit S, partial [Streptococcus suis]
MKTNNNIPSYRFQGYTDAWELRKLGEVAEVTKLAGFEFTEHVVYSEEGNIIALRGLNIKDGRLVLDDVKYIDGSNFSKLNRSKLYVDDIMFTYVGTVGEVAIIKENDRFYLAPNVSRIRVQSEDSSKFISHYIRSEFFYNRVIFPLIAISSQPALSMENIRKFDIFLPIINEEQIRISELFDTLDQHIALHQRKLDTLKEQKKTYLKLLFPVKGQTKPALHFQGFEDDWEEVKLGEVVSISSGYTGDATLNNGKYKLTRIETISEGKVDVSRTGFSNELPDEKYRLNFGDILFSNINSLVHIGKVAIFNTMEEV